MQRDKVKPDKKLEELISKVCEQAREISPEARIEVSFEPFEDTDVTLHIYAPTEEKALELDEKLHQTTFDILLDEGYFISVLVYEPDGASEGVREED